jgi:hypothetical protein
MVVGEMTTISLPSLVVGKHIKTMDSTYRRHHLQRQHGYSQQVRIA